MPSESGRVEQVSAIGVASALANTTSGFESSAAGSAGGDPFLAAVKAHQDGKLDEAGAAYRAILRVEPNNFVVMNNLALIADKEEAEALLRKAVELNPLYITAHMNLGDLVRDKGDRYSALQCYEAVLRLDQDNVAAIASISNLVFRPNKIDEQDVGMWRNSVKNHNYVWNSFHSVTGFKEFSAAFARLLASLHERGRYVSDNLICWHRNLSFLDDAEFVASVEKNLDKGGCLWRVAILVWAARHGRKLEGDFVECGTYRGGTARIICDCVEIKTSGKQLWLYDVFNWSEGDKHFYLEGLDASLHEFVVKRFEDVPDVRIIKGYVPESFGQGMPESICFLHIDMNNATAELGALGVLWDRVVAGGMVILDDYGWLNLRAQKEAADHFLGERGYSVVELPTGQGLVVK